jgi:hypothetical protein
MPSWRQRIVARIRAMAESGQVALSAKVVLELIELGLPLRSTDVVAVLQDLAEEDLVGRIRSEVSNEWLYVFKPEVGGMLMYVKVAIREKCVVISFHEDNQ